MVDSSRSLKCSLGAALSGFLNLGLPGMALVWCYGERPQGPGWQRGRPEQTDGNKTNETCCRTRIDDGRRAGAGLCGRRFRVGPQPLSSVVCQKVSSPGQAGNGAGPRLWSVRRDDPLCESQSRLPVSRRGRFGGHAQARSPCSRQTPHARAQIQTHRRIHPRRTHPKAELRAHSFEQLPASSTRSASALADRPAPRKKRDDGVCARFATPLLLGSGPGVGG